MADYSGQTYTKRQTVAAGSVSTYTNCLFNKANGKSGGAALYVDGGSSTAVSGQVFVIGSTFSNCYTTNTKDGGAVYIKATVTNPSTISASLFSANTASNSGGAVYIGKSKATSIKCLVDNSTFTQNIAAANGGAIYIDSANAARLQNLVITQNTATGIGGGVYTKGTLTIADTTISGNTSEDSAGGVYCGSPLTLQSCIIVDNVSGNNGGGAMNNGWSIQLTKGSTVANNIAAGNGGGIYSRTEYVAGSGTKTSNITNSLISGNISGGTGGGAIFLPDATDGKGIVNITGSTFTGNTAAFAGGVFNACDMTITDSYFLTCTDDIYNGHLGSFAGTLTLKGSNTFAADIFSESTITAAGSTATFANKHTITVTGKLDGIAAVNFNGRNVAFAGSDAQDFTNTAITISCDLSAAGAGAYSIASGNFDLTGKALTIISGETPYSDLVAAEAGTAIGDTGYALYLTGVAGNQKLYVAKIGYEPPSNCVTIATDTENSTDFQYSLREAAVTYAEGEGTTLVTFADGLGTVELSSALSIANDSTVIQGNASGTVIKGDIAAAGGSLALQDLTFSGRAGVANGALLKLENVVVSDSESEENGGALLVEAGTAKLVVDGATFSNNASCVSGTTSNYGGAVYLTKQSKTQGEAYRSTISNALFAGNTCDGHGGAIFAGNSNRAKLDTCIFVGNTAAVSGGAIYAGGHGIYASNNVTVDSNYAGELGGGIRGTSTLTLANFTITNNFSGGNGGGIGDDGGTLTLTDSLVSGNTASAYGGGIYSSMTVKVSDLEVCNNVAKECGGGLYVSATSTKDTEKRSSIKNSTFTGNYGGVYGGAVYSGVKTGTGAGALIGDVTISGSTFTGNTASNGGAIYNNGILTVKNSVFEGNKATSGGAIRSNISRAELTLENNQFLTSSDSVSATNGTLTLNGYNIFAGALYAANPITATGSTVTFINTAKVKVTGPLTFGESATGNIVNINGSDIEFALLDKQTQNLSNGIFNFNNQSAITVTGALTGLSAANFNGREVTFASEQDFSTTTISMSCDLSGSCNRYKIASGTFGFGDSKTFTVYDTSTATPTKYENVTIDGKAGDYTLKYSDNLLYLIKDETAETPSNKVTITFDEVDPLDHQYSLREAAVTYNTAGGADVTFDAALNGKKIDFYGSVIELTTDTALTGNGTDATLLQGTFANTCGATLNVKDLTMQGNLYDGNGGTIRNLGGSTAALTNVVLTGNTASAADGNLGGAIYNSSACLSIKDSLISGNMAYQGSAIYNTSAGDVLISGSTISGNLATGNAAIYSRSGTLTIENSLLKDNAYFGEESAIGTVIYANATVISITGSTVSGNVGTRTMYTNGAADVTFSNSLFQDNVSCGPNGASNWGGVLAVVNTDTEKAANEFSFTKCDFIANTTYNEDGPSNCRGGALYFYRSNSSFTIDGCNFTGNLAGSYGGAVAFVSGVNNTATVSNSAFTGNYAGSNGGAIDDISGFSIAVDNVSFSGNTSGNNGGAIALINDKDDPEADFSITGATFTGNSAAGNGGAMYIESYFSGSITGSTFSGNAAAKLGGALYINAAATIADCAFLTITDTIYSKIGNLTFAGSNEFAADIYAGNAVTVADNAVLTFSNAETITVDAALTIGKDAAINFNGKTVTFAAAQDFSNTAISITVDLSTPLTENLVIAAGGLNLADGKLVTLNGTQMAIGSQIGETGYTLRYANEQLLITLPGAKEPASNCVSTDADVINDEDFKYSLREAAVTYKAAAGATAITFADSVTETVKLTEGDLVFGEKDSYVITGNAKGTTISGRIDNSGILSIQGAGAAAPIVFDGSLTSEKGGAVYNAATTGQLLLKYASFSGNCGTHGGAVFIGGNPAAASTVSNAGFTGNTASLRAGALYIGTKADALITDSIFENNSCYAGGAMYLENQSGSDTKLVNLVFNANTSSYRGGALYTSVVSAENVTITDNLADKEGGGVYGSSFAATGCTITGNTAGEQGGGIYSNYRLNVKTGTLVANNYAGTHGGGGYVSNAKLEKNNAVNTTIDGATFSNNQAGKYGGGVYMDVYNSTVSKNMGANVTDAVFEGNTAGEFGGALYNSGKVAISKTYFVSNLAGYGGAIYSTNSYGLQIDGSTFTDNTASNRGGALYNRSGATISNSLFAGNIAERGGAIFNDGSNALLVTGSIFTANTATGNNAGALFLNGASQADIIASTFTGNVAKNSSGAISLGGSAKKAAHAVINISTCSFDGNQAQQGTGLLLNGAYKDVTVEHCSFTGNSASGTGAAAYVYTETVVAAFNTCSFVNNVSEGSGGGVSVYAGTVSFDNCTFAGNVSESGIGGALYIRSNSSASRVITVKDSSFETASDTIYNTGTLILSGTNNFAADIYSTEAITATGSTLNFVNTEVITVDAVLTGPAAISFNGGIVKFAADTDFSGVAITINGTAPGGAGATVAYGNLTFGAEQTFTVYGQSGVKLGEAFNVGTDSYTLSYSAETKTLEVRYNAQTQASAGSITETACQTADGGYAAKWNDATQIAAPAYAAGTNSGDNVSLQLDGFDVSGKTKAESMVFGGAQEGERTGNNSISLYSGTAGYVFGGGNSDSTDKGEIKVEVKGGVASQIFGGGMGKAEGGIEVDLLGGVVDTVNGGALNADVSGAIEVTLVGGTVSSAVNGGSRISSGIHTAGDVTVSVGESFTMNSGTSIYGAGMALYGGTLNVIGTGEDVRTVKINVSGGDLGEVQAGYGIFGGGLASGEGSAINADNVVINVNDGTLGNIYGGGWAQQGAEVNVGNITINVEGGEGGGFIYGGGAHSKESVGRTTVDNVNINISAASGFTTIYAGGQIDTTKTDAGASVGKDRVVIATITVTGSYDITSNLCGQGYQGSQTVSSGNSSLLFNGFTGRVMKTVADFDKVVISGNAAVDFVEAKLDDQHNGWEFDFTGRTAANAVKTAAVFDDVFGEFSLQTNADLLSADSWQLFSAGVSSFDDDWAMNISYDGGAAQSVKLGGEINLGGTDWVLTGADSNDDSPSKLVTLSKKTTPAI